VASLPTRLKPREVSIERTSHPNRFPSQWPISASEKIVPSSHQRSPSIAPLADPTDEVNRSVNIKKESS
jgi:hypothetical protein